MRFSIIINEDADRVRRGEGAGMKIGLRSAWRWAGLAAVLAAAALGSGSQAGSHPGVVRRARYLMGSLCEITAFGPDATGTAASVEAALDRIEALDRLLSDYRDDSPLSELNRDGGGAAVPPELERFLRVALGWARETGGVFDPTVGALVDAWDLRGAGRVPLPFELDAARAATGFASVRIDPGGRVRFERPGLRLDPGGIGKGYALDRAAEVLRQSGVQAALLDFGGQLLALGAPPGAAAWEVAVADPSDRDRPALVLRLRDASAATSGQAERGRRVGPIWVGHVLDPRDGRPVPRQGSVTVVAPDATAADALSTALLVLGPEPALAWAGEHQPLGVGFLQPEGEAGTGLRLVANQPFTELIAARRADVAPGTGGTP